MMATVSEPSVPAPSIIFSAADAEDIIPHEDDPMVLSVIMMGQNVHRGQRFLILQHAAQETIPQQTRSSRLHCTLKNEIPGGRKSSNNESRSRNSTKML